MMAAPAAAAAAAADASCAVPQTFVESFHVMLAFSQSSRVSGCDAAADESSLDGAAGAAASLAS